MKKKNCSKNGHQFIWTTVFGLLDTRNLYFFFRTIVPAPNQPTWFSRCCLNTLAQSHPSNGEEIVRAGRFSRFAADHMEHRGSFSTNCPHDSLSVSVRDCRYIPRERHHRPRYDDGSEYDDDDAGAAFAFDVGGDQTSIYAALNTRSSNNGREDRSKKPTSVLHATQSGVY